MILGPFITRSEPPFPTPAGLTFSGYRLELATDEAQLTAPIYRRENQLRPGRTEFRDYLCWAEELPFEVVFEARRALETAAGEFFPLDCMIEHLFLWAGWCRDPLEVFLELRRALPMTFSDCRGEIDEVGLLRPEIERLGFRMRDAHSYGRRVTVDIDWRHPDDDLPPDNFFFDGFDIVYRPRPDGTLGKASLPTGERGTPAHRVLFRWFKGIPGVSDDEILTPAGERAALRAFEWTRLARMTAREARAARVAYVRRCAGAGMSEKEVALGLLAEELYAEGSDVGRVITALPSLMKEAEIEPDAFG